MNRVLVLSVLALLMTSACASAPKKAVVPDETSLGTAAPAEEKSAPSRSEEPDRAADDITSPVYFAYNSSEIDSSYAGQLQALAAEIRSTNGGLVIEGHTDERGSTEFNLALGERRAQSTKQYLVRLGVSGQNINTISYGEERPAAMGDTESAHSKNRRAEFILSN